MVPSSPHGPVQHREDDVDLTEVVGYVGRVLDDQPGRALVGGGQLHARPTGVDRGQLAGRAEGQPLRVAALEHPASVGGDPDRHHVVRVLVDRGEHAARRDAGDAVLVGAATEDDCDAGLAGRTSLSDPTGGRAAGDGGAPLGVCPMADAAPCIPRPSR